MKFHYHNHSGYNDDDDGYRYIYWELIELLLMMKKELRGK